MFEIFDGGASWLYSANVSFNTAGEAWIGDYATATIYNIGLQFGFYLYEEHADTNYFSHAILNTADNYFDHTLIFDTRDITSGILRLVNADVIVAFEDLSGNDPCQDNDFNDMVVGVRDVTPIPTPSTLPLLASGMIGLVGVRRRQSSHRARTRDV